VNKPKGKAQKSSQARQKKNTRSTTKKREVFLISVHDPKDHYDQSAGEKKGAQGRKKKTVDKMEHTPGTQRVLGEGHRGKENEN